MKKTMKKLLATVLLVTSIVTFAPKVTVDAAQVEDVWRFDSLVREDFDYTNYDITGDGQADTIKFSIPNKKEGEAIDNTFEIYVNGSKMISRKEFSAYAFTTTVIPYGTQTYLFTKVYGLLDGDKDCFISTWKNGKLEVVVDLFEDLSGVGYYIDAEVQSVYKGNISIRYNAQNDAIGYFDAYREYKVANQTLTPVSYKTDIYPSNLRLSETKSYVSSDFVAKKNIKVYKDTTKKTVSFTLKKGKKIAVSKAYIKNGTVLFYGKSGSKKGWFVPKLDIFKDVALAG